jgi:hypothetical protein
MSTTGGPNIERDGLVFGYDTGYGINTNNISSRFYPGMPTTNYFNLKLYLDSQHMNLNQMMVKFGFHPLLLTVMIDQQMI